jgi:glutathione synthase/RimK-type ligase-like ATP-grasp enzyme
MIAFNEMYPEKTLIVKPEAGCQGKGIYLTNNAAELENKSGLIVQ